MIIVLTENEVIDALAKASLEMQAMARVLELPEGRMLDRLNGFYWAMAALLQAADADVLPNGDEWGERIRARQQELTR